jgi:hypothetical protein
MQDFYRIEQGYEQRENDVAMNACVKLEKDMHYEPCVQAIITFNAEYRHKKVTKEEARNEKLTKEEYMMVNI